MNSRIRVFLALVVLCGMGAGGYVYHAAHRTETVLPPGAPAMTPLTTSTIGQESVAIFARQAGAQDGSDGAIGFAPLSDLAQPRFDLGLHCGRVHMRAGHGICLEQQGRFPIRYVAVLFDAHLRRTAELDLAGTPSRAQVSPSGRRAAVTVFVSGHSYVDVGFSTRTSVIDVQSGKWLIPDMETTTVRRDGRVIKAVDMNFWGVTFAADDRTFYATMSTRGQTYLIHGSLPGGDSEVIADAVECPSLSPDERRIAYKHRVSADNGGPAVWRISVLDLASGQRQMLAETRSVDDQVQWLDDGHVLYSLPGDRPALMNTWTVPSDGSGTPQMFLAASYSAAAVR